MLKGIDTSHYAVYSPVQLRSITEKNFLYFNFVKASEGATIKDNGFAANWTNSRGCGLLCGAYHFFRPLANAEDQARNFITQYKMVSRTGVLPPVVDIEWAKGAGGTEQWLQIEAPMRIAKIKTYLQLVESELSIKPIIYTATGFWKEFIEKALSTEERIFFAAYNLWIVDLKHTSVVPALWPKGAAFTQYHFGEQATTPDAYDKTDQNYYNGDLKGLLNLTAGGFTLMRGFPSSNIVKDVQDALVKAGHLKEKADGVFGGHTETAVKDFQAKQGFYVSGIVDQQTWNKLLS